MSTRGLGPNTTLSDYDLDLEAVADRFGQESAVLIALGSRGHHAIRFAAAHPNRVKAVVWNGAAIRNDAWPGSMWKDLPGENWRLFLSNLAPRDLPREEQRRRVADYESCVSAADWSIRSRVIRPSDITSLLPSVTAPILVTHSKEALTLPVRESTNFAAAARNARLVLTEGDSPVGDASALLAAIDNFLVELDSSSEEPATGPAGDLSERELEVLRLLAQGKSNPQIAEALFITRNTVQNHVASILTKTNLQNRAQAAVYAKDHGII